MSQHRPHRGGTAGLSGARGSSSRAQERRIARGSNPPPGLASDSNWHRSHVPSSMPAAFAHTHSVVRAQRAASIEAEPSAASPAGSLA